ncbi:MAG: UbiA family prenyltransferase [archaeon]|nr:UbiA family prenyltransferase [archaeon]
MNKYLRLFRFGNGLMGIIGLLVSIYIAVGTDMFDQWLRILIGCVIVLAFVAGGNSINDYIDAEIDKTAHPDRPVPKGEITATMARNLGIGGLVLATILAIPLGWFCAALVLVCSVMMFSYEVLLKQRGFIGNICIAVLTGAVFIFAGSIVNDISKIWILGLLAGLVSVGREISKDIEDMDSDKGSRITLPMAIGTKKAATIAAVFYVLGPALSFIPFIDSMLGPLYAVVIVADILFIYCAVLVFKDAHKSAKIAKIAMFVALISFILGVAI